MHEESDPKASTVDLDRIRAAIGPIVSAHGVALLDLEWVTGPSGRTLRLTLERPGSVEAHGGVTLDDCAEVSRDVSALLDVEELVRHRYNLEVSSPGVERRLRTEAELARFVGRLARVKLRHPAPDGQMLLRGELAPAPEGRVAVVVDGKRVEVPFGEVGDATLVFELASQPKKGQRPARGRAGKRSRGAGRPAQ